MNFEIVTQWILIIIELVAIFLHLRSENRKRIESKYRSKVYHPTFWSIILTLVLISSFVFIVVQHKNPRVFTLIYSNWTIIWKGVFTTVTVSLLSILLGSILGVLAALVLSIPKRKIYLSLIDSSLLSIIYILLGIPA